jgi:hypothetical protein
MSDTTPVHHGRCLCGGVRFRIDGALAPIQVCHCGQCRRAQGTAFATNIPVPRSQFMLEAGAALLRPYESSPGKRRHFCSTCGSPVYSERDGLPGMLRIRAGLLNEPVATRPGWHFHVGSACSWWSIDDALPRHEASGPAPTPAAG